MFQTGAYTNDQLNKLGNAIIFLCKKLEPYTLVSKTHILKLIFIIEELSVKHYGIPMFGIRFDVWKLGPVSKDLFVELTDEPVMLAEFIERKQVENEKFAIVPKLEFSHEEFSDNEINLLEQVADRFKYCTTKELIDFTHRKDSPWFQTAQKNGLLDSFDSGKLNTTNIEIELSQLIQEDKGKLLNKRSRFRSNW